jgi:hypothetical protein
VIRTCIVVGVVRERIGFAEYFTVSTIRRFGGVTCFASTCFPVG